MQFSLYIGKLRNNDFAHLFEDETKFNVRSENKLPLKLSRQKYIIISLRS